MNISELLDNFKLPNVGVIVILKLEGENRKKLN